MFTFDRICCPTHFTSVIKKKLQLIMVARLKLINSNNVFCEISVTFRSFKFCKMMQFCFNSTELQSVEGLF